MQNIINIDTVKFSVRGMEFEIPEAKISTVTTHHGEIVSRGTNRLSIQGKHGHHNLIVRTFDHHRKLTVAGSLGGFLYGQNVFTSSNLRQLCMRSLQKVFKKYDWARSEEILIALKAGEVFLERVDLACNFRLESEGEVRRAIERLKRQLPAYSCGVRMHVTSASVAPNDAEAYELQFYAKGAEMRHRTNKMEASMRLKMNEECRPILRVELRLHGDLKKHGLDKLHNWSADTPLEIFGKYMKSLRLSEIALGSLSIDEISILPQRLRPVYALHKIGGVCLDEIYPQRTLQRFRRDFLGFGVDIRKPNELIAMEESLSMLLAPSKAVKGFPAWFNDAGIAPS